MPMPAHKPARRGRLPLPLELRRDDGVGGRRSRLACAACVALAPLAAGQPQPAESSQGPFAVIPDDYNPEEPPKYNNTVLVSVEIGKLHSVSADSNVVTMSASIWRYWYDERLHFDGKVNGSAGLARSVAVNPNEIWTPDLDLVEKVDSFQESCNMPRALIFSDASVGRLPIGIMRYNVFWTQTCVLDLKCLIEMDKFPFDTHTCNMTLVPWTDCSYKLAPANLSGASLITEEYEIRMDTRPEEYTWHRKLPGDMGLDYSGIRFHIYISRYSRYYVLNLVCPLVMMVVLSWFVFFTPINKSDRLAYSASLLLAAMAVQFITADKRPPEDEDGWIDIFMVSVYVMIIVPILETAVLHRIESLAEKRAETLIDDTEGIDDRDIEREKREVLTRGHLRVNKIDRVMRVVYPVIIIMLVVVGLGPGSPAWSDRHVKKSAPSWSLIILFGVGFPMMLSILCCSIWNLYRLGPHSIGELYDPLREALLDPHGPDDIGREASALKKMGACRSMDDSDEASGWSS